MMGMSANVDQDHRRADTSWIETPTGWHFVEGKIALDILEMNLSYRADHP